MMQFQNFEAWVWTELLAFDNTAPDCGAQDYLDELGYVPQGMCLLLSSPDFVLNYAGVDREYELPPDVCARGGQSGNERRKRQVWTNFQLRKLVAALREAGCAVYCSFFAVFLENKFHREWLGDHPEARLAWASYWRGQELNPLAELADGTLLEDIFIPKVVAVCRDYGFAGWHGPDGWGPWSSGNIMDLDFSDATVGQFLRLHPEWEVPECFAPIPHIVTQSEVLEARKCGRPEPDAGMAQLRARKEWICENHFDRWREFLAGRWVQFWKKALTALHREGFKGVINSAWTKGSFDAFYEFGIDYRRMAALGLDAMVVETVALGMSQTRPHNAAWYHDSYAAALAEIKAANPGLKLIFLHGIKDVEEFWDNLRHAPAGYERELYKLANMYVRRSDGSLDRAASGLLGCLADGIDRTEWNFIRGRWTASFSELPVRAGALAALFSDAQVDRGVADYACDGFMPALEQVSTLMQYGTDIQSFVRLEDAEREPGALLVPGAHLLDPAAREALLARSGAVVFTGRAAALEGIAGYTLTDGSFAVVIAHAGVAGREEFSAPPPPQARPGMEAVYFSERRYRKPVAEALWRAAAAKLEELFAPARVVGSPMPVSLLCKEFADGSREVAVENRAVWGRPRVVADGGADFDSIRIVSTFPPRVIAREGRCFTVPVPPRGIAAVRLERKGGATR